MRNRRTMRLMTALAIIGLSGAWAVSGPVPGALAQEKELIETEIGIDTILSQRGEARQDNDAPAAEKQPPSSPPVVPPAAADMPVAEKQMAIINQSLRNALEENKALMEESRRLEEELKELRGQSVIRRNRINNLLGQRDELQSKVDIMEANSAKYREELEALRTELARTEALLKQTKDEVARMERQRDKLQKMGLFWDPNEVDLAESNMKLAAQRIAALSEENEKLRAAAMEKKEALERETSEKISRLHEENEQLRRDSMALLEQLESQVQATFSDMKGDVQKAAVKIQQLNQENERMRQDTARLHYNLANMFFERGDYERAVKEYQKVLEIMPNDPATHYNLAFVSGEYLKDTETALEHYQQYLYLRPNAEDVELVKEKILEAKLSLQSRIDSPIEGQRKHTQY